jgi:hypothetical protein
VQIQALFAKPIVRSYFQSLTTLNSPRIPFLLDRIYVTPIALSLDSDNYFYHNQRVFLISIAGVRKEI